MKKAAVVGFLLAMAVVHAIIATWSPIQGDDWGHWVWASSHTGSFLGAHYQFSELAGFLLSRETWFHVLVSPAVSVALVIGAFTVAMRRLPEATWDDALALALVGTAIWIGGPRAGVVWFHRSFVAADVYGVTLAVWLIAPLACNWRVRSWQLPLIALGGYCVGTSTRTIATAALIGTILAVRRRPRETWHRVLLGALVIGTAVGYARPPWIEFWRVLKRGLDPNLVLINFPIREGGELTALVIALVLVDRVLAALGRPHAPDDARPDPTHIWHWLVAWFAIAVWALFGPHYSEATLLPATIALTIGALPTLMWLARGRYVRYVLVGLAIGVHAVAWTLSLRTYHKLGAEGDRRLAILEGAPRGTTAIVPPYSQELPTFFFFGEDFGAAGPRQLVAIDAFGLADITIAPPFRKYEPNPHLATKLEVDGATDAQIRAAQPPARWATETSTGRYQFTAFAKRLRALAPAAHARLAVTNVPFDRPLAIAELDHGAILAPTVMRSNADANDRYTFTVRGDDAARFDHAWIITDGTPVAVDYKSGHPSIQPLVSALDVLVICSTRTCIVADAFLPRF